ncbi:MAG: SAM-dependent methyltransferase [Candidatus Peregrinibacteria bacterium GW2011_GWF2_33_10]|nr:MAG: SAM-dependent methyltransferase [Candidatus Peregrinibacteria bacterium GW2011_GWF2_33_10]OGJ44454.1 MAG: 23S rRNA (uracil-5-)-methyltransferase RumA [Candidatus Peregrinibacteria bacterium RIFOXYA12_FULL_33_12]OGJ45020.1 MAG: 23S rRNA (uracil-5-)-methyltransferase RumA [Candidatus Peregrinibacteria bacterium RIFOXYA2_FULL_33_21]OGJ50634.1 MAG: 23S rRNA (uracil-5-)-methyltransferase RumA [Candidatus Peregrinibacteria bacterium RIFOXYB2_FULL_33_20]
MPFRKGQIIELKIDKLMFGGSGIGVYENLKVFVDKVVPGDLVQVTLKKIKKNYAEAKLEKMIKPSSLRIKSKCRHFGVCGGCSWQFLDYQKQLEFKQSQVVEALGHIGFFQNAEDYVENIIGCEEPWFYRNKMEFTFGDTLERKFALGLHESGRIFDVVDIECCYLQSALSNQILGAVRKFAQDWQLNFFRMKDNQGLLRNLVIREGKFRNEVMVNLVVAENFKYEKMFVELMRSVDRKICSIYLTKISAKRGQETSYEEKLLWGKEWIEEEMSVGNVEHGISNIEYRFKISPKSFFQPNSRQAQRLYSKVLEFADLKGEEIVYDLYCGTGTIGIVLSKFCRRVYGLEIVEEAINDAKANAILNQAGNIEFLCGDAGVLLSSLQDKPDVIVVDPPRAGLSPKAMENILKIRTERIMEGGLRVEKEKNNPVHNSQGFKLIYVSCNPSTLARDLKIFCENGFKLIKIQPVDMFPHTYHIENVAVLEGERE